MKTQGRVLYPPLFRPKSISAPRSFRYNDSVDKLIIFARAPRLGQVKTRLAAELGNDELANESEQRLRLDLGLVNVAVPNPGGPRTVVVATPRATAASTRLFILLPQESRCCSVASAHAASASAESAVIA